MTKPTNPMHQEAKNQWNPYPSLEALIAVFHVLLYSNMQLLYASTLPRTHNDVDKKTQHAWLAVFQHSPHQDPEALARLLSHVAGIPIASVVAEGRGFVLARGIMPNPQPPRPQDHWQLGDDGRWYLPLDSDELLKMTAATMRRLLGFSQEDGNVVEKQHGQVYVMVARSDADEFIRRVNDRILQDLNGWFWVAEDTPYEKRDLRRYLDQFNQPGQTSSLDALRHAVLPKHCVNVEYAKRIPHIGNERAQW